LRFCLRAKDSQTPVERSVIEISILSIRRKLKAVSIVSKPDRENNHILYDIPEDVLESYRVPTGKLAQMFPEKEGRSRDEAVAIVAAGAGGDEVQAYSGQDVCYAWQCDANGRCAYVWWYC
jgi:hypothetical protein